ncbi:MAG: MFS transporter [Microbacter sp.]
MTTTIWNKNFILLTLSNFLMCVTYYALISTLPVYLSVYLHADNSSIGLVLAIYTVASVTVRPFSGYVLDQFNRKMIFLAALLLYTIVFLGYLVAVSILFITLLRFAQGLGWGISTISGATMAVDQMPVNKRGEGIGYYSLSTTLGMSVGPLIGLFLARQWNYHSMFWGLFLIGFLGFLSGYAVQSDHRPMRQESLHSLNWDTLFYPKAVASSFNLLIVMMAYGGLLSFVALYGHVLGVQNTSWFFFIFAFGIAMARITVGKVFDQNGPGTIMTFCLLLDVSGFLLLALWKIPMGYFLSALIIGFGNGVVFPVFQTMVNNLADSFHRGAANSTLYTALDLGMGSGMMLVGLVSSHTSLSAAFILCALLCLIGLFYFRGIVLSDYNKQMVKL